MRAISVSGLAVLAVAASVCIAIPAISAATSASAASDAPAAVALAARLPSPERGPQLARPAAGAARTAVPATTAAQDEFSDVSCLHAGDCMAVGGNNAGNQGYGAPLSGLWNGSWHDGTPALPAGSAGGELYGVSCVPASAGVTGGCMAVGYHYHTTVHWYAATTMWTGSKWTLPRQPALPSGAANDILSVVSCTSMSFCAAVGYYLSGKDTVGLLETWSGTSWTATRAPAPSSSYVAMASVSCPAAGTCYAVGTYTSGSNSYALIDELSGGTWTELTAANPNTASGYQDVLQSVSCASTTVCEAVGTVGAASGKNFYTTGFAEGLSGGTWSVQKLTWPAGSHSVLYGVSCPTATYCLAAGGIGAYATYNGGKIAAYQWSNGAWSGVHQPSASGGTGSVWFGATCLPSASPVSCIAVGDVGPSATAGHALSGFWAGTSWKNITTA